MSTEECKYDQNAKNNNDSKYKFEILPDDYIQYDLTFKVIVIGDSGVGKTCLSHKATQNIFEENYNATIGFEFFVFNIKLNEIVIKLQVWDTCGQELYRSIITNFYRNASLAILVYGINSEQTFENMDMWLRELRSYSSPDTKIFLIGNKVDLEDQREVKTEIGEKFAKENGINLFLETSAKTGFNAQKLFIEAARILYEDYGKYQKKNLMPKIQSEAECLSGAKIKKDNRNSKCCI